MILIESSQKMSDKEREEEEHESGIRPLEEEI